MIILPNEPYLQIFQRLSEKDLRRTALLVCKQWYQVIYGLNLTGKRLNLSSPFNRQIKELSRDFERFPSYAQKVNYLTLTDNRREEADHKDGNQSNDGDDDIGDECKDYNADKIGLVFESCPNLKKLKISTTYRASSSIILPEILYTDIKFGSLLEILELDLPNFFNYQRCGTTDDDADLKIDICKLINYTFSGLRQFKIYSSGVGGDHSIDGSIIFTNSGEYNGEFCSLKTSIRTFMSFLNFDYRMFGVHYFRGNNGFEKSSAFCNGTSYRKRSDQ